MIRFLIIVVLSLVVLSNRWAVAGSKESTNVSTKKVTEIPAIAYLEANQVYNPESVIPPQCYTKTEQVNNPCYVCHQNYAMSDKRPNIMNDGDLQGSYAFSELGETNHWKNLFENRQSIISKVSDQQIDDYVSDDNYTPFIAKLKKAGFGGDMPELEKLAYPEQAFGAYGLANDGSHWVAFNYKPFPSTFWPTNGSTGDVMIRLPAAFREQAGRYAFDVYYVNLALMEMAIKEKDELSSVPVSEDKLSLDLDGDGKVSGVVERIKRRSHYVGDAHKIKLEKMLYPQGTEILHTVRYIAVDEQGEVYNSPRMKEVRYMKKHVFKSKARLASSYYSEKKEKEFEKLPQTVFHGDKGIANGFGWTINGFIEDKQGQLRQQNHQELSFCNGCHKSIGTTIDQTFSFPRKVDGAAGWGYIDLHKMTDVANINEAKGEYLTYMERVGGGDEFRQNKEMLARWFNADGRINAEAVQSAKSLYELITPSAARARKLNKAYYSIVQEQSYIFGRDASIQSAINVHQQVNEAQAPLIPEKQFVWDMRLIW